MNARFRTSNINQQAISVGFWTSSFGARKLSVRMPVFKTVLVGEGGVGKTSLAVRYTEDRFDQKMKMTILLEFFVGMEINGILWNRRYIIWKQVAHHT